MSLKKIIIAVMLGGAVVSLAFAKAPDVKLAVRVRDIEVNLPNLGIKQAITVDKKNRFKSIEGLVKTKPSNNSSLVKVDVLFGMSKASNPAAADLVRNSKDEPWSSMQIELGDTGAALVTATASTDPTDVSASIVVGLWPIIVRRRIQTGADGTVYLTVADTNSAGVFITHVALLEGGPVKITIDVTDASREDVELTLDVPFHFFTIEAILVNAQDDIYHYHVNTVDIGEDAIKFDPMDPPKPKTLFDNGELRKLASEFRHAASLAKSTQ